VVGNMRLSAQGGSMYRWLATVALVGGLFVLPGPHSADAQEKSLIDCVNDAVKSCDEDFKGNDVYMAAVRGYCYMIRSTICYASREQVQ